MRSNPAHQLFNVPTRKYFTIWFKFLDFLRSPDRLEKKISLQYLFLGGEDACPSPSNLEAPSPDDVEIVYVQTG